MPDARPHTIHDGIVLAAGNGDRFHGGAARSKLHTPVAGVPLLIRTLVSARDAGITDAHVVLGYDAARVRQLASERRPAGMRVHFHLNRDWHRENGVSVLAARDAVADRPFALLMGDHIFDPDALRRLARAARGEAETLLGVDARPTDPGTAGEATKVRLDHGRVVAIGKALSPYDALDTGLFVCTPRLFAALEESCAAGDTTLTGGVRRLAARGLVRAVDIGQSHWCDIDTVDDLDAAEELIGGVLRR